VGPVEQVASGQGAIQIEKSDELAFNDLLHLGEEMGGRVLGEKRFIRREKREDLVCEELGFAGSGGSGLVGPAGGMRLVGQGKEGKSADDDGDAEPEELLWGQLRQGRSPMAERAGKRLSDLREQGSEAVQAQYHQDVL